MSEAHSEMAPPERGRSVKGDHALESLNFRTRTTGEQAAARSRMVRRLRIALPVTAIVLLLVLVFNTNSNNNDDAFLDDFKSITAATEELRMSNPRFAGIDDDGKPYEITAAAALQSPGQKNIVELEKPRAIQGAEAEGSLVTAAKGRFLSDDNILELNDDVTLRHELGAKTYVLKAPTATVLVKDQLVTSDAGVAGVGPDGATLSADHMKAYRGDGRVVFEGNVNMRFYPKADDAEENDEASAPQEEKEEQ